MTFSEAESIVEVLECLLEPDSAVKAVISLSDDPIFNLAVYLKYSFSTMLTGMSDEDWMKEAETVLKIARA